jgi:hypothetical protein
MLVELLAWSGAALSALLVIPTGGAYAPRAAARRPSTIRHATPQPRSTSRMRLAMPNMAWREHVSPQAPASVLG